jgi:4-amino-4-deoxy-L-arabinose transferase-like glycosyltransferase
MNHRRILIMTLIVSVILRCITALFLGNQVVQLPGTADQLSYHSLALRVLQGYGFSFGQTWWPLTQANAPTAHWSFLYTGYLVLIYALFGPNPLVARLVQAVLVGLLHPYLAYLIGRRLFGNAVGLATAILTSVYTYFVYYSATLMTESFYITAILGGIYLALRIAEPGISTRFPLKMAFLLGLTLGLAVLLRQLFLLFVPFLFLWLLWAGGRRKIGVVLLAGLVIGALILPITLYNASRFDRFVLLNTNAGYALFWGNHPIYGTHFESILPREMGSYQELIPEELRHLDEAALDQALLRLGIQFIVEDPVRFGLLSLSRIPAYFMFWPTSDSGLVSNFSRVSSFGLMLPFMLYGLWISLKRIGSALFQSPPAPILLLLLFISIYTLIHLLSWALIRYRLPVDAVLLIFAGLGIIEVAVRIPYIRHYVEQRFGPNSVFSSFLSGGTMK